MSVEIINLFDRWNDSLKTQDSEIVVKNYAHDAILLPTLSNTLCTTNEAIKKYFDGFLLKKPAGKINEGVVKHFGDLALHAGIYTFSFGEPAKSDDARARFSFLYKKEHGKWVIVEHHSSLMPESATPS